MKNKYSILILAVAVAVKLSHGYSIKQPAFTASYSGSSASSSAYSHASSSSYSFNGDIKPHDVDGLKEALKAGAVASASAGAIAGAGAGADAGAGAGSSAIASASAIAGSGAGVADSGTLANSESTAGQIGSSAGEANADGITGGSSGCSDGATCRTGQVSNTIGESSASSDDKGAYKVIASDKYNTGYSGGTATKYAVGGQYVQATSNTGDGCVSCKGPFPGPNGSIHDYKPASSVPAVPNAAPSVQPALPSSSGADATAGAAAAASYQPQVLTHILPGAPGSIYASKPVTAHATPSAGQYATGSESGHVSPGLIATLPGPSGSIHDSKPASAGQLVFGVAEATASAGAGLLQPVATPSCSNTPGSPNSHCGTTPGTNIKKPFVAGPGLTGIIAILPGPGGSIHDSRPANSVSGVHEGVHRAGSTAGAGVSSGAFDGTGSITNIPPAHGPACVYTPGATTKCGSGVLQPSSQSGASAGAVANANANGASQIGATGVGSTFGSSSGSGSVSNIPSSHPIVGPTCSYSPGSPNKCGPVGGLSTAGAGENAATHAGAGAGVGSTSGSSGGSGSVANIPSSHPIVGPTCSYSPGSPNKCGSVIGHSTSETGANAASHAGAGAGVGSTSGFSSGSGSLTNIPSSHPIVGPVCSYTPGSPNKCGPVSGHSTEAGANAAAHAGAGGTLPGPIPVYKPAPSDASSDGTHGVVGINVVSESGASSINGAVSTPSIHPELPASGLYYINKPVLPSVDIEPPLVSSSPSFSGQIPCADSSCGSVQKTPFAPAAPVPQAGPASGAYSGFQASAGSSGQYESLNHDKAHLSGGIVFEDDDGSYHNIPTTTKRTYMNAEGGYAVSSNSADNTGFVIGPGTGLLPIESDDDNRPFGTVGASIGNAALAGGAAVKDDKPFGTQGAFGGSAAFSKSSANTHSSGNSGSGTGLLINHSGDQRPFGTVGAATGHAALATGATVNDVKDDKPFGTQGAFGGSAAFSKSTASAENSEIQPISGNSNDFDAGDFAIQKSEGILVTPVSVDSDKPACGAGGGCGSGNNVFSGSGLASETSYFNGQVNKEAANSPVKLECTGSSCGDTEVFVIEERPSNLYSGSGSRSGSASGSGFATGQVLVNQGGSTHDVTNSGSNNAIGGSYSGSQGGAYSGNSQYGSSGCSQCGGYHGFGVAGSFGVPHPGGFLDKLFGAGGLSGTTALNRYGGSGAYSNAGSYASGGAGSFASAGASASAHSGSYASSF